MKTKIKRLISVICFILVFLFAFQAVNLIFRDKAFIYSLAPVYDLPKDSLDVLFFGSSHMNCTISPMQLYKEQGISSFNCAIGDQAIPASYYTMKEMLRVQKPEVIVLETFYMGVDSKAAYSDKARLHWLTDNIPWSSDKAEMLKALPEDGEDKSEYYLPLLKFHSRWKNLSENDFNPELYPYLRGANLQAGFQRFNTDAFAGVPREDYLEPSEMISDYLDKIIALCEENDVQLVFMAAPFWVNYADTITERAKYMNYIYKISEEKGIPYVDFFNLQEETGFNPRSDMKEWSHLNIRGVEKITSYMGSWLKESYDLADHRNDSKYSFWDEDYKEYEAYVRDLKLQSTYGKDDYFEQLDYYRSSEDYLVCVTMYEADIKSKDVQCWNVMKNFCKEMPSGKSYGAVVLQGDKVLLEKFSNNPIEFSAMLGDKKLQVGTAANPIGINMGSTSYARRSTGINIVVYDLSRERFCDSINFISSDYTISRAAK